MPLRTYRKGPTAKGLISTGFGAIILGAAMIYGCGKVESTVNGFIPAGNGDYGSVAQNYNKLSYEDKVKFMDGAWDTIKDKDKVTIVGDDLGIKVTDLYKIGKQSIEEKLR